MRKITIDSRYTKTYKTEKHLNRALEKLDLPNDLRYLLCEVGDRVTAVFINPGIYMTQLAHKGFKVIG
jgi:hypothetical protein